MVIGKPFQMRIDVRNLIVSAILIGFILAFAIFGLMVGTLQLTVQDVFLALLGDGPDFKRMVVIDWRLPRILAAIAFGAALAVSGAIFQSLTKNPLGSPDIIGFSSGSYTGVLITMLILGENHFSSVAVGALIGGFMTAVLIYLLAFRNGINGFRLIIVGIAISTILGSLNTMLLQKSKAEVALMAASWGVGSLNGIDWQKTIPGIALTMVFLLGAAFLYRPLKQMTLGHDTAKSHGVAVKKTQLLLIAVAVALTAATTAMIGPVSFVALAAPQIAFRMTKSTSGWFPVACTGAFLLLGADILAQRLVPGSIFPVGVVTLSLGGIYLIWLLIHQAYARGK